jgi:predicted enzyme related to lactoylglutathione lyase
LPPDDTARAGAFYGDIDAKIEMAKKAGGELVLPRKDVSEMGIAWAIIGDTEGNRVGILQNL